MELLHLDGLDLGLGIWPETRCLMLYEEGPAGTKHLGNCVMTGEWLWMGADTGVRVNMGAPLSVC